MPPEIVAAIMGPIVGAIFGVIGFTSRRNYQVTDSQLDTIRENIELVHHQVTSLQIKLPTSYVTKDEFNLHCERDAEFHEKILLEMRQLREEIIVLRTNRDKD